MNEGVPTELALQHTVQADGPGLTQLIKNLDTLSTVAFDQQAAVVSLLAQLPEFVDRIAATATGASVARHDLLQQRQHRLPLPLGCPHGRAHRRHGVTRVTNTCAFSAPDLLQRGAGSAPVSSGG